MVLPILSSANVYFELLDKNRYLCTQTLYNDIQTRLNEQSTKMTDTRGISKMSLAFLSMSYFTVSFDERLNVRMYRAAILIGPKRKSISIIF